MGSPFSIKSARDAGFELTFEHNRSWHPSFASAARGPLGPVRPDNVFDRANAHGIGTVLTFDGTVFVVELEGGDAARTETLADAEEWLARTIRASRPDSGIPAPGR